MTQNDINAIADMVVAKLQNASKDVLTLDEAAAYMGVSRSQMYQLTHNREIPHSKPRGKMCYFKRSDLYDWMMSNPVATSEELADRANEYCMKKKQARTKKK